MRERRKKKRGRKLATLGLLGALGAAVYWFLQFSGAGLGLPGIPGLGDDSAEEQAEASPSGDAAPEEQKPPCELRVDAEGIHLDGQTASMKQALAACREPGQAMLTVTGDARYGTFERTRDALEQAGIEVRVLR